MVWGVQADRDAVPGPPPAKDDEDQIPGRTQAVPCLPGGGNAVIQDQNYLNKINVFPVPDADTGTNLASTMKSIARGANASRSMKGPWPLAQAALHGARGNSGLIFAQ